MYGRGRGTPASKKQQLSFPISAMPPKYRRDCRDKMDTGEPELRPKDSTSPLTESFYCSVVWNYPCEDFWNNIWFQVSKSYKIWGKYTQQTNLTFDQQTGAAHNKCQLSLAVRVSHRNSLVHERIWFGSNLIHLEYWNDRKLHLLGYWT